MHYLAAVISIILGAVAQYFLKIGVTAIFGKSRNATEIIKSALTNFHLWAGLCIYGVSLLLWFYVLSRMELSKAYPMVSLGYILTLLLGYFFLNEAITLNKVAGISLIMIGVFVLTR